MKVPPSNCAFQLERFPGRVVRAWPGTVVCRARSVPGAERRRCHDHAHQGAHEPAPCAVRLGHECLLSSAAVTAEAPWLRCRHDRAAGRAAAINSENRVGVKCGTVVIAPVPRGTKERGCGSRRGGANPRHEKGQIEGDSRKGRAVKMGLSEGAGSLESSTRGAARRHEHVLGTAAPVQALTRPRRRGRYRRTPSSAVEISVNSPAYAPPVTR